MTNIYDIVESGTFNAQLSDHKLIHSIFRAFTNKTPEPRVVAVRNNAKILNPVCEQNEKFEQLTRANKQLIHENLQLESVTRKNNIVISGLGLDSKTADLVTVAKILNPVCEQNEKFEQLTRANKQLIHENLQLESVTRKNNIVISGLGLDSKTADLVTVKVVPAQLRDYIEASTLLSEIQSEFRKGHGCSTALLTIIDEIIIAKDAGEYTVLILLEFSCL
nr:unnamed protein product [Callosobruchus analis]